MSDRSHNRLGKVLGQTVHMDHLMPKMSALLESAALNVLNLGCGKSRSRVHSTWTFARYPVWPWSLTSDRVYPSGRMRLTLL